MGKIPSTEMNEYRVSEVNYLFRRARNLDCTAIVGVSNMGKSDLMRHLQTAKAQAAFDASLPREVVLVYIDCNRMLEMSEQGFYELTLRCILESLNQRRNGEPQSSWMDQLQAGYGHLVNPPSPFHIPLGFNRAMTVINEGLDNKVVLLFDEFDEPLAKIDRRIFLNLRALKDQYPRRVGYMVATQQRLGRIRSDREVREFIELFAHNTFYLPPMSEEDGRTLIRRFVQRSQVTFDKADIAFILDHAGGHPGLLDAVCQSLGTVTGQPLRTPSEDSLIHREVSEDLAHDAGVRVECQKIWQDLSDEEKNALLALFAPGEQPERDDLFSLLQKHILLKGDSKDPHLFSRLFGDFVRRQGVVRRPGPRGIYLDVEAGEVFIDGKPTGETLTNLEYRLLLLLYGQLGKICDKYQVVEAVWGEDYIDEVDDARIEKLVSRLRQKIELDSGNPHYLLTVRGRGYKLVGS